MCGLVVGFIVPPLFIEYGNRGSYIVAAVVITVFCVVALLAQIHGCRDTPDMIQAAIKQAESKTVVPSFSTSFKQVFARKNFRTLLIVNMCFQSVQTIVLASVAYYVQSVLQLEADFEIALLGVVIVSIVLSIPVWSYFMRRFGARKTLLVGAPFSIFGLFLVILPLDLLGTLLAMVFIGFGVGGGLISQDVAYADVIDEDLSIHKTRREGLYYGVNGFMIRLSLLFQVIAFSLIHFLTNYVPGSAVQSAEAIFGIRLQFGFVPLIFMTIVLFLVWKFYDLGPAKVQQIKAQVAELGL